VSAVELELLLVRVTGWVAAVLLLLAIAPLGRHRRTFGLASLSAALLHLAIGAWTPLVADFALLLYEPHLRAGATALLVLLFMGATSFPSLVARLGIRQWKPLHRAVYPAALLVLHHALLSPHLPRTGAVALSAAIVLLIARRLSPW
jgi:sulfoxide reductase heme-binding subunit YedZ